MSSAVLDRVLAIPDYDDLPQMGLSKAGLAASLSIQPLARKFNLKLPS